MYIAYNLSRYTQTCQCATHCHTIMNKKFKQIHWEVSDIWATCIDWHVLVTSSHLGIKPCIWVISGFHKSGWWCNMVLTILQIDDKIREICWETDEMGRVDVAVWAMSCFIRTMTGAELLTRMHYSRAFMGGTTAYKSWIWGGCASHK